MLSTDFGKLRAHVENFHAASKSGHEKRQTRRSASELELHLSVLLLGEFYAGQGAIQGQASPVEVDALGPVG